jgi:putative NIF3 family GTP cyclohydrolase 1 type 2
VVGAPEKSIHRVAIACGAAGEFLDDARRAQADVFVTGEMRFHDYLAAQAAGIALILPGHYATERFAVERLAAWLQHQLPTIEARPSERERDPILVY